MVVQKAINNLKDKPKEDRQAVAIGMAGTVVIILLIAWAFFVLKGLRAEQSASQPYPDLQTDTPAATVQNSQTYNSSQATDQFGRSTTEQ